MALQAKVLRIKTQAVKNTFTWFKYTFLFMWFIYDIFKYAFLSISFMKHLSFKYEFLTCKNCLVYIILLCLSIYSIYIVDKYTVSYGLFFVLFIHHHHDGAGPFRKNEILFRDTNLIPGGTAFKHINGFSHFWQPKLHERINA